MDSDPAHLGLRRMFAEAVVPLYVPAGRAAEAAGAVAPRSQYSHISERSDCAGCKRPPLLHIRASTASASAMHAPLSPIISVSNLSKTYASGFQALKNINLDIRRGEIFALLGPNGAGKTTLINIICGIVNLTEGAVLVDGHDIIKDFRATRSMIGLVPQELATDAFETVLATVTFSRGLFGKPRNAGQIEKVLRELSMWDRKDSKVVELYGGGKR